MSTPLSSNSSNASSDRDGFIRDLNLDAARAIALDAYCASMQSRSSDVTCLVVEPPSEGSYNVVYELRFSDGTSWALRIPFEYDADTLRRDLIGHQFIASHTSLPVPKIHAHSLDADNALGHPYRIMDFARGTRLVDVWYDRTWWNSSRTKERTLSSLARHMVQLASIEFSQIGLLDIDESTGMHRIVAYPSRLALNTAATGPDYPLGPFETQFDYLTALLNSAMIGTANTDYVMYPIFVGEMPNRAYNSAPFTLCHPDLDSQNVFIDDETGEISALIDWDNVASMPRELGALTYPAWLTVDWDPVMYESYKRHDRYDSADDLTLYREMYLGAVRAVGGDACAEVTRNSHITSAVRIGLVIPHSTRGIMLQLGKLVCGSAELVLDFVNGVRGQRWLRRDPGKTLCMDGTIDRLYLRLIQSSNPISQSSCLARKSPTVMATPSAIPTATTTTSATATSTTTSAPPTATTTKATATWFRVAMNGPSMIATATATARTTVTRSFQSAMDQVFPLMVTKMSRLVLKSIVLQGLLCRVNTRRCRTSFQFHVDYSVSQSFHLHRQMPVTALKWSI